MNLLTRMVQVMLSFLLFLTITYGEEPKKPISSILPRLESFIRQSLHQKKVPGMAVAVVEKGKIVYLKCFGVRVVGQPAPITPQTLFQIGSVSKAITSTLIAILNRDKEISLDHPSDIIPGATLKNILNHTTGIPSPGFNALIERGGSPTEARQLIQSLTSLHSPGEKFAYHNVVYNLSTDILEKHMGDTFESLLQKKLLKPLGMKNTSSTWEGFISAKNRVGVHKIKKSKRKKGKMAPPIVQQVSYRKDYTNFPAAGGMSSTIQDMALFLSALMGARSDILSPLDLEEFIHPTIHTPDQWLRTQKHRDRVTETRYGLGWRHMTFGGHPLLFHGGWLRGFSQMISFLPDQEVGIVILQNAESPLGFQISMQFFDWVLGLPPKNWDSN